MYHSHHDEAKDTWAGLAGPIVVTRAGASLRPDGSPEDVDAERVLFFAAIDESQSLYNAENVERYLGPDENITALMEVSKVLVEERVLLALRVELSMASD